jgi:hypothetical protein
MLKLNSSCDIHYKVHVPVERLTRTNVGEFRCFLAVNFEHNVRRGIQFLVECRVDC